MKRKQAIDLGISESVIDDGMLDIGQLVVADEFKRRNVSGDERKCYRERALMRLIKMGVPFSTDSNISSLAVKSYLRVTCPYCDAEMVPSHDGGNSHAMRYRAACKCGAAVEFDLPTEHALHFRPPAGSK